MWCKVRNTGPARSVLGLVVAAWVSIARPGNAELVSVPLERQAELLARVAAYDRNMTSRAGGHVHVLILANEMDPESVGVAKRMEAALRSIPDIAGLGHDERGRSLQQRRRSRSPLSLAAHRDRVPRGRGSPTRCPPFVRHSRVSTS
jgi:hypothetical protein